ncbi:caspase-3 isoform X2 [Drosophila willistoni]|nr:caspase-3 isoform X2 [Drosophila willistoni]
MEQNVQSTPPNVNMEQSVESPPPKVSIFVRIFHCILQIFCIKPAIPKTNNTVHIDDTDATNFSGPERPLIRPSVSTVPKTVANKKLKPAHVYIFNHEKFDTQTEYRVGSEQDVKALRKVFKEFNCKVEVITNATVATVKSTVKKLEQSNFEKQSALVIVVLSHGDRHDKILAKDLDYYLDDDIIFPILRNRTLVNKPKMVIVQACKGSMMKGGFKTDAAQPHGSPTEVMKCYSTYEGYVSFRYEDGTPFIQTFCDVLKKFGKTKHIDAIMTDVRIAIKNSTNDMQIPSVHSTLTQQYVFGDYI